MIDISVKENCLQVPSGGIKRVDASSPSGFTSTSFRFFEGDTVKTTFKLSLGALGAKGVEYELDLSHRVETIQLPDRWFNRGFTVCNQALSETLVGFWGNQLSLVMYNSCVLTEVCLSRIPRESLLAETLSLPRGDRGSVVEKRKDVQRVRVKNSKRYGQISLMFNGNSKTSGEIFGLALPPASTGPLVDAYASLFGSIRLNDNFRLIPVTRVQGEVAEIKAVTLKKAGEFKITKGKYG